MGPPSEPHLVAAQAAAREYIRLCVSASYSTLTRIIETIQKLMSSEDFMSRIDRLKRDRGIALPWDDRGGSGEGDWTSTDLTARLPRPIVQLSLPKSASECPRLCVYSLWRCRPDSISCTDAHNRNDSALTLSKFFACGDVPSRHTHHKGGNNRIGDCMLDNFLADEDARPPFSGCDVINFTTVRDPRNGRVVEIPRKWADGTPIEFYSDIGVPEPRCFYSTVHDGGLEHIARHHPDSTMVLIHRGFDSWYDSVKRWGKGRLLGRWRKRCGFRGTEGEDCAHGDEACWRSFYDGHTEKIRRFALDHLDMTYIEVGLDEYTAGRLEYYTGIRSSCLEHCLPGKPKDPTIDRRTYKQCKPVNRTTAQAGEVNKTYEDSDHE